MTDRKVSVAAGPHQGDVWGIKGLEVVHLNRPFGSDSASASSFKLGRHPSVTSVDLLNLKLLQLNEAVGAGAGARTTRDFLRRQLVTPLAACDDEHKLTFRAGSWP